MEVVSLGFGNVYASKDLFFFFFFFFLYFFILFYFFWHLHKMHVLSVLLSNSFSDPQL